jgi:hypothetical protein
MGSHLFTPRSGLNLGIRMRKTYIFLQFGDVVAPFGGILA